MERVRDAGAAPLRVGEHDVPVRLRPPSRLVGRDDEAAVLAAALDAALTGQCRGVLLSGVPGVGKTALAEPGDPLTAQARVQRATAAAVRAVASRDRPVVVVFLDDLQWAGSSPLGVVDLVLSEEPVDGLLLIGAYRDGDVDAAHPLAALRDAGVLTVTARGWCRRWRAWAAGPS